MRKSYVALHSQFGQENYNFCKRTGGQSDVTYRSKTIFIT